MRKLIEFQGDVRARCQAHSFAELCIYFRLMCILPIHKTGGVKRDVFKNKC